MKKSRIALVIGLLINSLIECFLPIIYMFVIFTTSVAWSWVIMITLLAVMFASAVIANIAAGFNLRTRWYAVALPSLVMIASWLIFAGGAPYIGDTVIALSLSVALLALSLISALITSKRQRKKSQTVKEITDVMNKERL